MDPIERLWKVVIAKTVYDYEYGESYKVRKEAEAFFTSDDFDYICKVNDFNKEKILERFYLIKQGVIQI